ncbi:MAG: hypothetical protein HS109_20275 [Burkholderiales bacterium]|nr:hypothetical protein [Burkholderiales bacterium]
MGLFSSNHPGHEGYLIGLVKDDERGLAAEGHMRRLAYPHDDGDRRVEVLQVGCDCGWRSARFSAPTGTTWSPFTVHVPDYYADAVDALKREMWERHLGDPPDLHRAWLDKFRDGARR